jgi:branched-chain amino acid transport system permease protein
MSVVTVAQGSAVHRVLQLLGWAALVAGILLVPFVFEEPRIVLFTQAAAFSVAVAGLNIVTGFSGQISLGHSAFMGVGAYTTAILVADHGWSFFATIPLAAAICFVVGVLIGIPALRLEGLYLALATLGLAIIFPTLVNRYDTLTGGSNGKRLGRDTRIRAPEWTGLDPRDDAHIWVYLVVVAIASFMFLLARNMLRSRAGRSLIALRDNAIGAEVSGIDIARAKVLAFGISAMYAGVAGSLFMFTQTVATGSNFSLNRSIELVTAVVIGGLASLPGSVLGGLLVVFLPDWAGEFSNGTLAGAVYGVLLIAIIAVHPLGIADLVRKAWSRLVLVVPRPPRRRTAPPLAAVPDPGTTAAVVPEG